MGSTVDVELDGVVATDADDERTTQYNRVNEITSADLLNVAWSPTWLPTYDDAGCPAS